MSMKLRKLNFSNWLGTLAGVMGALMSLHAEINDSPQVLLPGSIKEVTATPQVGSTNIHKAFISRPTLKSDESDEILEFQVALKMRNFSELQVRVGNGERISPAELMAKYYPLESDYQTVISWLVAQGFKITGQDTNCLAIFVSGRVRDIQQILKVNFARVMADGKEYTSAISAPSVPSLLSSRLLGINGLQPHLRAHKHLVMTPASGISQEAPYSPSQIAYAYNADSLYSSNVTGSGQAIAVVIDTFPNQSDLTQFWQTYGVSQSINNISFIQVVSGTLPAPSGEETLDVEWSSSIAPGANVRVYATKDLTSVNLDRAYQQIYADVTAHPEYGIHQMSISYGIGETYTTLSQVQTDAQYFANLASAGVTVFASSGDGGATPDMQSGTTGPQQAESPASDPNVTGVGGTTLDRFGSETGWSLSGGGTSIYFSRPSWQVGSGIPSGTMRVIPDVACAADPYAGGVVILNGSASVYGGTSWGSPTWAGFCALLNQIRLSANLPSTGLLGPKIYPLLGSINFRDITSGNNGFNAGPGFDLVTGIGVPNVQALAQTLGPSPMTVLHTFGDGSVVNDGSSPRCIIKGADGNFYGVTTGGGTTNGGTAFKMTPLGVVTILHNFNGYPNSLIQGSDGNFYGTTYQGGSLNQYDNYSSTVFKMSPQGSVTILYDFGSTANAPNALVQGIDGDFYGTTQWGGSVDAGIAYKITSLGAFTLLHQFSNPHFEGSQPSGLIQGSDGNFYGTCFTQDSNVFQMTPQGDVTVIHRFPDSSLVNDGVFPKAPLVQGGDGSFYGTTSNGGTVAWGTLFKITSQGVMTILHEFEDGSVLTDGGAPSTALVRGADNNFYGITSNGGVNLMGNLFKIAPDGTETILHNFGAGSVTASDATANCLIQDTDGTFYGTASGGGNTGQGLIFKLSLVNALNITSSNSANFTAGVSNSFTVITSGTPTPVLSVVGLPAWASFNASSGILSGFPPTTNGSPFVITITASNGVVPNAVQSFTLNVQSPTAPAITSAPFNATFNINTVVGFNYQASGYPHPMFSVTSGTLPPGITLSPNGYMTGAFTQCGLYTGIISASNGVGASASQNFSIAVQQSPTITNDPLSASVQEGSAFSFSYQATGYPSPTYSANYLPPGFTLSASGVLSGTPTQSTGGPWSGMTVTVSNGLSPDFTQSLSLTILEPPSFHTTDVANLPTPLNVPSYWGLNTSLTGYPTPSMALVSGTLPPGLNFNSNGVLSGTPTQAGVFTDTFMASNGIAPDAAITFTFTVSQTYSQWVPQYFPSQNQAIIGPGAMPMGDGIPNLLKYFCGIMPSQSMSSLDRAALPQLGMIISSGTQYLTLTYHKSPIAMGVTAHLQTSSDLLTWQTVTPDIIKNLSTDATTGAVVTEFDLNVSGLTKKFIRLNVTSP